jgi:hypothetical protein
MKLNPVFAANMGYDIDAMNDDQKVTVVRRRVVYEELVMSKDEFQKLNKKIKNQWDNQLSELEMVDIQFPDFVEEETVYIAFPGDVTSFTDDAIGFLFKNKTWTDAFEPVKIAS